jgi:(2Fe-2S) ferredoxin
VKYPRNFSIDEKEELYGHIKGWSTHLIVATGKTDWVRDVADEKGSIMEAVDKGKVKPSNGVSTSLNQVSIRRTLTTIQRLMLSASNIPVPDHSGHSTTVLLLPSFQFIDNVTPANTPELIKEFVNKGPTTTSPLSVSSKLPAASAAASPQADSDSPTTSPPPTGTPAIPPPISAPTLKARPCPHKYLILLCSQKTRDARCGQSAPLLLKEFQRHLRPLGLDRDLHDERPGGVGIYFISHVGGHKFSANVMIYRKASAVQQSKQPNGHGGGIDEALKNMKVEDSRGQEVVLDVNEAQEEDGNGEAAQCIWLARVRPEDCENIIRYTVLQGKVVKPERQLRGGFDRCKQLASW